MDDMLNVSRAVARAEAVVTTAKPYQVLAYQNAWFCSKTAKAAAKVKALPIAPPLRPAVPYSVRLVMSYIVTDDPSP